MTTRLRLPRLTVWQWIFAALMLGGLYATYVRVVYGLGGATNLSDEFPWGLWIGFDILCGVGLAAGGFTLAAIVYIFNLERYKPILRATILTAFLGYLLVIVALLFDLGRPYRIWHPLVMWNPRSVMFEVAWCVMLYTTVLALEFVPVVFERVGWQAPLRWMGGGSVPPVLAGRARSPGWKPSPAPRTCPSGPRWRSRSPSSPWALPSSASPPGTCPSLPRKPRPPRAGRRPRPRRASRPLGGPHGA